MGRPEKTREQLLAENEELHCRNMELESALEAIGRGQVDAVVTSGPEGEQVYTLKTEDYTYRMLIEQTAQGALSLAPDGLILYANQSMSVMLGIPLERLTGSLIHSYLALEDRDEFVSLLENVGSEISQAEFCLQRFDDTQVPVIVSLCSLRIEEVQCISMSVTDLSDREKHYQQRAALEKKLHEAQKLESLGALAGGIAHDFNNMLMGVLGYADLALGDLPPESPILSYVQNIKKTAIHLAELTRQMLAYSGKGKFVVEPVNLSKLVDEMAHLLQITISKKAVIKFDLEANLPSISADASQLNQVILNLITNASEAIGEKSGVISLSTGVVSADSKYLSEAFSGQDLPDGFYVYLEVSDNGHGMDQETCPKIFDPFFTTKFAGRGLGLSAILGIMRGHKGAIKVYSEPGRGTTFRLLFPSAGHIETGFPEEKAEVEIEHIGGTILVADDEETVCAVAKLMLERAGFDVLTAGDGHEALELLRAHVEEVSAVLLDLTMPHMDGIETFKEIRRLRPDLPVILSSGYNEQDATNQFAGKGLAGFIQKPYGSMPLIEKLREVLMGQHE